MRNILDNIENAAAKLQSFGEKTADQAKDALNKVGGSIERAMDDAKEAIERAIDNLSAEDELPPAAAEEEPSEKPLTFEEALTQEVDSQVDAIRAAQQTPGAFSDYIAKKFGKNKEHKGGNAMSINYVSESRSFYLAGGDVSYVLHVTEDGHLMNLYWGKRVPDGAVSTELVGYPACASFDMEANRLPYELPVRGSGWYGAPAVSVINAQGNDVVVLEYVSHSIYAGKKPLPGLPATYVEDESEAASLEIELVDPLTKVQVTAVYTIYEANGAITRSLRIANGGSESVVLNGAMAASAPLYGNDYEIIHLKGA